MDGLAHTREAARPGFSLALGQVSMIIIIIIIIISFLLSFVKLKYFLKHSMKKQQFYQISCFIKGRTFFDIGFFHPQVLNAFEDVSLQSILDRINEKHNLQAVKKVSILF